MSDKIIDVFLLFSPTDRNKLTKKEDGKRKVILSTGPHWDGLVKEAKAAGYTLKIHGPTSRVAAATISNSFKNSVSTIIVGHGAGSVIGKKWVSDQIKLTDGMIIAPDGNQPGGLIVGPWDGNVLTPSGSASKPVKPETNEVTALFTCNSHDKLRDMFRVPEGSNLITSDGGADGFTRVGTLENSAYAFVAKFIRTGGNLEKAAASAQYLLKKAGEDHSKDKGDKIHVGQ